MVTVTTEGIACDGPAESKHLGLGSENEPEAHEVFYAPKNES
jgi:hypothetical protein